MLAATLGYDEKTGVSPTTYKAPKDLAQNTAAKQTALGWIDANESAITKLNDDVWQYAELSLREWKSSQATANLLKANGFTIEWGSAGFPTAFVATYGNGGPVLGFNAEYDALAKQIQQTPPGEERDGLIAEISKVMAETMPQVYLADTRYLQAFGASIDGYHNAPNGAILVYHLTKG